VARAELDGMKIRDWDSFHSECSSAFGFPAFYGRNMNAWIDCLTYIREGDGLSRYQLGPDDPLVIHVFAAAEFKTHAPEIFDALIECATAVNLRHLEIGEVPALHFVFR